MHQLVNGVCVTCAPAGHVLLDGRCPTCRTAEASRHFDPALHPHDPHNGEFTATPGGAAAGALKDTLRLAEKIDLDPDEKLVSSSKIDGGAGGIRMALTEQGGKRMLRLGLGGEGYGRRNREEGIPAWDGNPSREPLPKAEYERLDAEYDALGDEYDSATPTRQDEITARQEDIREQLAAGDEGFNGTAKIDEYSMGRLADKIRPALAEAVEQEKVENAAWDEIEAFQAKGNPDPARLAELQQTARAVPGSPGYDGITFTSGIIPGSAWGDVHYSVELDDLSQGPEVRLGVQPKDAPDDWGDDKDWQGRFDAAETRKFLRQLDKHTRDESTRSIASHYDPQQFRDPQSGKWVHMGGGFHLPHTNLFGDKANSWDDYERVYEVLDESTVGSFTAISMTNGETQVAFDDSTDGESHRYVVADGGPDDLRELADIIDRLLDGQAEALGDDDVEPDSTGLVDYLPWGEGRLGSTQVGYDRSGDVRFTVTDTSGKTVPLPELSADEAAEFADALRTQAQAAEDATDEYLEP